MKEKKKFERTPQPSCLPTWKPPQKISYIYKNHEGTIGLGPKMLLLIVHSRNTVVALQCQSSHHELKIQSVIAPSSNAASIKCMWCQPLCQPLWGKTIFSRSLKLEVLDFTPNSSKLTPKIRNINSSFLELSIKQNKIIHFRCYRQSFGF